MIEFARAYYEYFLLAHVISTALGLGAATISDILFFRFLKDLKITAEEAGTLRTMSQVIWVVLVFIIISGLMIYLPQAERLNSSPIFLVKITAFAVIIINGIGLNLLIAPRLTQIFSGQAQMLIPRYWRKLSYAGGAVSIASWYSAFILGSMRTLAYDFPTLLSFYLGFVLFAVIASQFMEWSFAKKTVN